ncbi:MAG TPA: hypothetical protein P5048_04310 [Chlamydiales bacterium]|nr:hypothetical protein [Chlamydiales bacterium]
MSTETLLPYLTPNKSSPTELSDSPIEPPTPCTTTPCSAIRQRSLSPLSEDLIRQLSSPLNFTPYEPLSPLSPLSLSSEKAQQIFSQTIISPVSPDSSTPTPEDIDFSTLEDIPDNIYTILADHLGILSPEFESLSKKEKFDQLTAFIIQQETTLIGNHFFEITEQDSRFYNTHIILHDIEAALTYIRSQPYHKLEKELKANRNLIRLEPYRQSLPQEGSHQCYHTLEITKLDPEDHVIYVTLCLNRNKYHDPKNRGSFLKFARGISFIVPKTSSEPIRIKKGVLGRAVFDHMRAIKVFLNKYFEKNKIYKEAERAKLNADIFQFIKVFKRYPKPTDFKSSQEYISIKRFAEVTQIFMPLHEALTIKILPQEIQDSFIRIQEEIENIQGNHFHYFNRNRDYYFGAEELARSYQLDEKKSPYLLELQQIKEYPHEMLITFLNEFQLIFENLLFCKKKRMEIERHQQYIPIDYDSLSSAEDRQEIISFCSILDETQKILQYLNTEPSAIDPETLSQARESLYELIACFKNAFIQEDSTFNIDFSSVAKTINQEIDILNKVQDLRTSSDCTFPERPIAYEYYGKTPLYISKNRNIKQALLFDYYPKTLQDIINEQLICHSLPEKRDHLLPFEDIFSLIIMMIEKLQTFHNSGFVHRDLKPENLFFSIGEIYSHGEIFFGDFGFTIYKPETSPNQILHPSCTPPFAPTELFLYGQETRASNQQLSDERSNYYLSHIDMRDNFSLYLIILCMLYPYQEELNLQPETKKLIQMITIMLNYPHTLKRHNLLHIAKTKFFTYEKTKSILKQKIQDRKKKLLEATAEPTRIQIQSEIDDLTIELTQCQETINDQITILEEPIRKQYRTTKTQLKNFQKKEDKILKNREHIETCIEELEIQIANDAHPSPDLELSKENLIKKFNQLNRKLTQIRKFIAELKTDIKIYEGIFKRHEKRHEAPHEAPFELSIFEKLADLVMYNLQGKKALIDTPYERGPIHNLITEFYSLSETEKQRFSDFEQTLFDMINPDPSKRAILEQVRDIFLSLQQPNLNSKEGGFLSV